MMLRLAVAAGLIGASAGVPQKPFPDLPNAFSAIIEANIVNKKYTIHMREYYSSDTERIKVETYSKDTHAPTTSILDMKRNQYIHVVNNSMHGPNADRGDGVCTWGDIAHIPKKSLGAKFFVRTDSNGPHLVSSQRMYVSYPKEL